MEATAVRDRPILFSGPMVRAILAGRKTMTRRVIKPQPDLHKRRHHWACVVENGFLKYGRAPWRKTDPLNFIVEAEIKCPCGAIGDRLWVKEPFYRNLEAANCYFTADNHGMGNAAWAHFRNKKGSAFRSIFLPRRFSRLNLEITDVRVEPLIDISSADCIAEGLLPTMRNETPAKTRFRELWDSINGERPGCSWDNNPWVWVVSFKKL